MAFAETNGRAIESTGDDDAAAETNGRAFESAGDADETTSDDDAAVAAPLVDAQGRRVDYLRVSVTDRCNYRCTYCMPDEPVDARGSADRLSFDEIVAIVGCFVARGVTRLRITGGEPTVRKDLPAFVRRLRALPGVRDIALSTNGERLAELARPLFAAGITRLSVSLDSLHAERFLRITRRGRLDRVLEGLEAARAEGFPSIKINTVALAGFNDDEIGALCHYAWARGFVPRFIEPMPMNDGQLTTPGELVPAARIRSLVEQAFPGTRLVSDEIASRPVTRGAGPARYWRLVTKNDEATPKSTRARDSASDSDRLLGIISAMTEHFCDTCNRVRLSAGGALHTCLAHDDAVDLRAAFTREGTRGVNNAITHALTRKRAGHTFQLSGAGGPRKSMMHIGG